MYCPFIGTILSLIVVLATGMSFWWLFAGLIGGALFEFFIRIGEPVVAVDVATTTIDVVLTAATAVGETVGEAAGTVAEAAGEVISNIDLNG